MDDRILTAIAGLASLSLFYIFLKGLKTMIDLTNIIGSLIGLGGLFFWIWAILVLGRYLTPAIHPKSPTLIAKGPFALVRHPIYFGAGLLFLALALLSRNPQSIPILLVIFWVEYEKARLEEEELLRAYPDYEEYRKKVSSLIPFVY